MINYLTALQALINEGQHRPNRTGVSTLALFGTALTFDLQEGFPIMTTKKINFDAVKGELIGFLRGFDNVKQFQELNCNIWNANAESPYWLENENNKGAGDLGRIYGVQWRDWRTPEGGSVDQLDKLLVGLQNDPFSRRHIITAWNPGDLDKMSLPPCHYAAQFYVRHGEVNELPILDCMVHMRSVDTFLGMPFNISSYALMVHIFARHLGYDVGTLDMTFGDTHIYENHLEQASEQLSRAPMNLPTLYFTDDAEYDFDKILPEHIQLKNYEPAPYIQADMAV